MVNKSEKTMPNMSAATASDIGRRINIASGVTSISAKPLWFSTSTTLSPPGSFPSCFATGLSHSCFTYLTSWSDKRITHAYVENSLLLTVKFYINGHFTRSG